jgi:hypothetical protein
MGRVRKRGVGAVMGRDRSVGVWTARGLALAQKHFPPEVLASLPVFVSGECKGLPKAVVVRRVSAVNGLASIGLADLAGLLYMPSVPCSR